MCKAERLAAVNRELEDPKIWDVPTRAQELGRKKSSSTGVVGTLTQTCTRNGSSRQHAESVRNWRRAEGDDATLNADSRAMLPARSSAVVAISNSADVQQSDGPCQLLHRHPGRQRRHRGAGLGGDADAHVPALLRAQAATRPRCSRNPTAKSRASRARRIKVEGDVRLRLPAHGGPACTGWCARARSTPTRAGTRRLPACSCIRKSTTRSSSTSIPPTCASTPSGVGSGRPAHQQDRLGGAHHPSAHQYRRAMPERPLAAPQPRRSDGDAEVEAL